MGRRRKSSVESLTALGQMLDVQGRRLVWVADRLGVDASTVSRWCSGERPIPLSRLNQLAMILDVAPGLLAGPDRPSDSRATATRTVDFKESEHS